MKTRALLLALAALPMGAQPFTFGAKIGFSADKLLTSTDSSTLSYYTYTNRLLIGPTGELRLPFGLGVEVDALYRHYNFQSQGAIAPGGTLTTHGATGDWEFPVLAKYRFPAKLVRPYVDAGVAWDTLQGYWQTETVVSGTPIGPPANLNQPVHNSTTGFVLGGGIDVHAPYVHVSPEIRYTHWGSPHFTSSGGGFSSNQNQVEVMFGITF